MPPSRERELLSCHLVVQFVLWALVLLFLFLLRKAIVMFSCQEILCCLLVRKGSFCVVLVLRENLFCLVRRVIGQKRERVPVGILFVGESCCVSSCLLWRERDPITGLLGESFGR